MSASEIIAFLKAKGHESAAADVASEFGGDGGLGGRWASARASEGASARGAGPYSGLAVETRLVQSYEPAGDPYGAANMPLYQTATFKQASATEFGDFDYTRSGNPTRAALERAVADAEGCAHALAFSTGMAALSAVVRLLVMASRPRNSRSAKSSSKPTGYVHTANTAHALAAVCADVPHSICTSTRSQARPSLVNS